MFRWSERLRSGCDSNWHSDDRSTYRRSGNSMMPTSMFGGLVLLTSLAAPEADQSQKRDEVRIELLGCITRNFLSLEGATTLETLLGEILSRCRPQLPACSTVNQCDAAQIARAASPAVRLRSKSVSGERKAVAIRQPTRSRSHFAALKIWRSITAVLRVGNPAPEGRN